jgi:uncharacterized membrane protein
MDWGVIVVQWVHVLGGIFWFGGALFSNLVLIPAARRLPLDSQRRLGIAIFERGDRVILPIAVGTIVIGFIRGTVFGPVKSLDVLLGTAYGITFLVALVAALTTLALGMYLGARVRRVYSNDAYWVGGATGPTDALAAVIPFALLELAGFFVVFTMMILMRFGL